MKNTKRIFLAGIIMGVFLISVMLFTVPSRAEMEERIKQENGIKCEGVGWEEKCWFESIEIIHTSSHFLNVGIFSSYEKEFELENGEKKITRTFAILGQIYQLDDGLVWRVVN
ncbi:hypothetical protein [Bacillus sp. J33]|uniref:hypothetical protein n=1 Tax=Bacillus sp. J33 TaxID=935836 RepID=UPI0004BBC740|nr:hypothetical protein [Bacillus sp. J33]